MRKSLFILIAFLALGITACKKSDFAESYTDPSKISTTTVEKQFTGFLASNREYVVPSYWNYFVVLRTTVNRYSQAVGWVNAPGQYVPGGAGINDRWNNYYDFLAQYRELQNVYSRLGAADQEDRRIYMIAAAIYFYDHTQKVVDLHGDIPWSEAGLLSAKGGNYQGAMARYDRAEDIYTKMMDDLKVFADELNDIEVKAGIMTGFQTQDFINKGDISKWRRYCNSLRLRMLTRVSGVPAFQARSASEIASILAAPADYPVVTSNDENILIRIHDLNTDINARGFRTGLEDWNGNLAGKAMIDFMKNNTDPRLRALFEPGINAAGAYTGLDPMQTETEQTALVNAGSIAFYNRSTLSRNEFFPGVLITAAEVSFLISEYYMKAGNNTSAKAAYETGVRQSIEFYYWVRTLSNDNTAGALTPVTPVEIAGYLSSPGVNWDLATSNTARINLLATQKWIHYNVVLPLESWAEQRRLNAPPLSFQVDASNAQQLPPTRWIYPANEQTYNTANYEAVRSKDNLNTRIFWDIN